MRGTSSGRQGGKAGGQGLAPRLKSWSGIILMLVGSGYSIYKIYKSEHQKPQDRIEFAISAGVFVAGFFLKLWDFGEKIENLSKVDDEIRHALASYGTKLDYACIVGDIKHYAERQRDLHVRLLSSVMADTVYTQVAADSKSIIEHAQDGKTISIINIAPAYAMMAYIAQQLDRGCVYIATSKLTSYESVPNHHFVIFKNVIEERSKNKEIVVVRLYYIRADTDPKGGGGNESLALQEKLQSTREIQLKFEEMREAAAKGIIVKYCWLSQAEFDNNSISHDLAFIFTPPAGFKGRFPKIDAECDPFDVLNKGKYKAVCDIDFSFDQNQVGNVQAVSRMTLSKPDSKDYVLHWEEFRRNWKHGSPVPPAPGG